jgi:hypothetical protein
MIHTDQETPINQSVKLNFKKKPISKKVFKDWEGLTAYIVNGKDVRETLDLDFTEGGNYGKYGFVPQDEIWLDDGQRDDEIYATLLHELIEYVDIIGGSDYNKAHKKASIEELKAREKPKSIPKKVDKTVVSLKKLLKLE